MTRILFLAFVVCFVISCQKGELVEHNSIEGKWKLTEYYADPGDGSGTWQPADPLRPSYLEFKADGVLIYTPSNIYSEDHYKLTSDSTMLIIRSTDTLLTRYDFSETLLILYPPCIEGCGEKYVAVH